MKNRIVLLLFICTNLLSIEAQKSHQCAFKISYNQVEIDYSQTIHSLHLFIEPYVGLGNQDINHRFDDFLMGLRIGTTLYTSEKNRFNLALNSGIYFSNNDYYTVNTPFMGLNAGYQRYFGKSKRHSLLANVGYQYGKKEYTQTYEDETIYVASIGEFKLSPLYFSVGYGFNF